MGAYFLRRLGLVAGFLATLPAGARPFAIIHLEGERPNRIAYFADISLITERTDPSEMLAAIKQVQAEKLPREQAGERIEALTRRPSIPVMQILESPQGPYARELRLDFVCYRDVVTISRNDQIFHHNKRTTAGPTGGPHPVVAPWVQQARRAACEEKLVQAAIKADIERGSAQKELTKLGMVLAVNTENKYTDLYDFAFDKLWKDGNKLALTSDLSPEEIAKADQQGLAERQAADKILDAAMTSVSGTIQTEDAERNFINGVAATFAKKPKIQWETMSAQAGWTEADLIKFWGVPQQVSELAGARVLTYRNESDERVTQNTIDAKTGQVIGSTTTGLLRQCELSLFLRPGGKVPGPRLVDFQMRSENCNIDTLGKNRPR